MRRAADQRFSPYSSLLTSHASPPVMRFASLGSGSKGNALLIEAGDTRILLDCGFGLSRSLRPHGPPRARGRRSRRDHRHARARRPRRRRGEALRPPRHPGLPHARHALGPGRRGPRDRKNRKFIDAYTPFAIGDAEVRPYTVPHDAREPVQFVLSDGAARLGVLTDTGCPTPHIAQALSGVDALVLECNHDLDLLMNGPYPAQLKRRIAGRLGHLSNESSADTRAGHRLQPAAARDRGAPLGEEQHAGARARGAGRRAQLRAGLDRHRDAGGGLRLARNYLTAERTKNKFNRQDAKAPRRRTRMEPQINADKIKKQFCRRWTPIYADKVKSSQPQRAQMTQRKTGVGIN